MDKKSKEICFRVHPEMHEKLQAMADVEGVSLPDLMKDVATSFIEHRIRKLAQSEKREFTRNQTNLPVVMQLRLDPGESFYRTGTILDISMGGVRISLPTHEHLDAGIFDRCQSIEILFRLPEEDFTVTFRCKPSRITAQNDDIELGAMFTEADLRSQQVLHKYVM
jgi:hypothetical protein